MKYPIGTKIIFTAQPGYGFDAQRDSGKEGVVVGYESGDNFVKILIPTTVRVTSNNWTWITLVGDIKLLKGTQLLFSFMEE